MMPLPRANPPRHAVHDPSLATPSLRQSLPGSLPASALHLWHLTSLDAPTVAVTWALGFAWAARIRLPGWVLALLALITWTLYVGDRLFDAVAADGASLRERHLFHWRHRRLLAPLAIITALFAVAMIFVLMPVVLQQHDSVLGVAALAYFSGVHSRRSVPSWLRSIVSKEFLVGIIFTAGCVLPAFSQLSMRGWTLPQIAPLLIAAAFFAALAWLNCRAIESWESSKCDSRIRLASLVLSSAGAALAISLWSFQVRAAVLVAAGAVSVLLLALLNAGRERLVPLTTRAAADLVLLTPLFLLVR